MTWKAYALASGAAFAGTYLLSTPAPRLAPVSLETRPAVASAGAADADIAVLADRLAVRVAQQAAFQVPSRDAFQYAARTVSPVPLEMPPAQSVVEALLPAEPARPPFGLIGIASDTADGVTARMAILTSLQGVVLVAPGDPLPGGYEVVTVSDTAVTLRAGGGDVHVLALSGSAPR